MAEKNAGGLYISIGLTLSQLQADFLAAEQTIKSGIAQLNRQQNLIKLKMETDVTGLDSVADKTKILEVQEKSLTQLLSLQRDKLKLAETAYQDVANSKGANSAAAKSLEAAMERERLAVARLEAQLKSLSAQKISIDTAGLQSNIDRITAQIKNVRLKAELDTSQLTGANAAFDAQKIHIAAVTKELDLQRQKLIQLRGEMYQSAQHSGGNSVQTLNIKSNVLQQVQEINRLEAKLKELQSTNVNLNVRADSIRQAEAQINENIARINARLENIRVKTEIDVSKLGAAATEFDKAKAHVQGLNRELDLQNKKLAEMKNALAQSVRGNGLNNVKTINLQTEIQRQIQAIDQLKAKIAELNKIQPPNTNSLLGKYLGLKGDYQAKIAELSNAVSTLQGATASADGAITAFLGTVGKIPAPVAVAGAALLGIPLAINAVENALIGMAKPAIAAGDSMYVMSRGMQLSVADMAKLSTIAKVTGIDINEVNNLLRRFSMQMTKAGENNLAAQTMKRYGAEIYDVNGRLKNAVELSGELGKALKAAEAEGNGAAFRDIVGGKFWSADFVTYLEDFADNVEQAKKVVKNGLANPTWAHAIQGELNTLNAQTAQLGGAFSAALMPVVAEIIPKAQERFGELTKVIEANKENIKFLGDALAVPVRMFYEMTDGITKLSNAIDAAKDKGTTLGKMFESMGKYRDDMAALMNVAPTTFLTTLFSPVPMSVSIEKYRDQIEDFKKARAEAEQAAKEKDAQRQAQIENTPALSKLSEVEQQKLQSTLDSMEEERIKREQETADIIYKINHGSYENSLHDLERWKEEQLRIITETEELMKKVSGKDETLEDERGAVEDNYIAKQIQLEQEKEARLAEIRQRISAADKTELENRMIAIEDEKDAWIKAGMEKAEAEQLAQKQLSDYVKNVQKDLSATLSSLYQTDLERRLAQIDQERQAWIDKCADEVNATKVAEQQKADAQRAAAMQVIRQQAEEYEAYQNGGFAGLQAYKMAQLAKSGVNLDYLNMTPQQLQQFQRANQVAEKSLLPNFMTDEDRNMYREQMSAWQQQLQQRAADYDAQNYAIIDGVKVGLSEAIGGKPIEIDIGKDSKLELSPDASRATLRDYTTDKDGKIQQTAERDFAMPSIVDTVAESFSGMSPAVQDATAALTELPTAVQGAMETLSEVELPQYEELTNPFAGMEQDLQITVQQFDALNSGVEAVTVKLSDLSDALANFALPTEKQAAEKTPVNVSVTVQIDEAHAWEAEHIQELADRVADVVEPAIINAIGGDSNSY